ncbi:SOUL family heme-binding protein [Polaribacter glomeratus]|uniref:Soul heme-binding protein n=1 Tax=Polaribacter glomeratus TaxID=102 RepID=A0A2S7WJ55_9FLAO|nr:heme-binding protein [Polaribacter glomeratus]PQJ77637.1 soul heme-binding protein [Polaribacter glomeratus]TXD65118.1 heme-binding protein [Polaribacter glomeratus]
MKILFIVLGVVAVLFILFQLYFVISQKNIEKYPYKVVKSYGDFEVRNYEASLFTSVKLSNKTYKETSSQGFSILAGYIFGGNNKNEKIAMTSPVAMTIDDATTMMFLVPKKYTKESLPKPDDGNIEFTEMPAKKIAAITFSGWANDDKIKGYKEKLIAALNKNGIKYTNSFYFLGYNAPFELLNRKNEVIVELK